MKIVLCGPIFNEKVENMLIDTSPAAGKFLNNMIDGFKQLGIDAIKAVYIAYPVIDGMHQNIINEYKESGFVVFKTKTLISSILYYQNKILQCVDDNTVVIFYNITYANFGLAKKIKKKGGKVILVLADYTDSREEKGILRKVLASLCQREFKKIEHIITLSKMPNIKFGERTRLGVVHGGIKNSYYENFKLPPRKEKIIFMYAGLLSTVTGVDTLLEAISQISNPNVEFYISGKGELEGQVRSFARYDKRVRYLGFLNQKEYLNKLNKSHVFINPRNMSLPQNSNNFPSKILEYLATGRIIISTQFSGHDEFNNNMIWFDGTAGGLAAEIERVFKQYNGIIENIFNKNRAKALDYEWNNQARKILKILDQKIEDNIYYENKN